MPWNKTGKARRVFANWDLMERLVLEILDMPWISQKAPSALYSLNTS